jgi:diguanylate cyclase (GGDEF)-like protein/PAS domain S-box-containing protein
MLLSEILGPPRRAEAAAVRARRAHIAKAETPIALIFMAVLVILLSTANFLLRPTYHPGFHLYDYAAAALMLAAGIWLSRPSTPSAQAPWVFASCMIVLAVAQLLQVAVPGTTGPTYVLIIICLTGPVALAWRPALATAVILTVGTFATTIDYAGSMVVDWTLLAVTASLASGVLLQLRLRSINDEVLTRRALEEQSQRLALVLESSRLGVWDWNMVSGEMVIDQRYAEIVGFRLDELAPATIQTGIDLIHPDDRAVAADMIEEHVAGLLADYEIDVRLRHKGDRWVWVRDRGRVVEWTADGRPLRMTGTHEDVTERKAASDELVELATHDPLTGLANRIAGLDEVARALASHRRSGRSMAVMMMDLDNFKNVNDTLGHATGDELLRAAADRIAGVVRAGDLVARPGGDEFLVVLRDLADDEALAAANRLLTAFRRPLSTVGAELYATLSIGLAFATPASDVDDLVREADTAMYVAKEQGRDRVSVFTEDLRAVLTERVAVERALRHALGEGRLTVWFQPEVDLFSGRIMATEALVRWHHPDGTTWTADRFIDVAEESGIVKAIDSWVLNAACRQGAEWAAGHPGAPVTMRVNVSALQLSEPGLLAVLDAALSDSGLDPALLCLEITETTLLRQTTTTRLNLDGIRARGVHLALDDFGTGYASLTYLRQFPVDLIKIDRSFVTHLTTKENDRRIVAGIIALAGSLSIAVTAEGVEHEDQADVLRSLGCPSAQGYLYSRAVPADELTALLGHAFV